MSETTIRRLYAIAALFAVAAVLFFCFFQINKGDPFREINPFGVDPYDAVGSFAFQAALLAGILTFARALRLQTDPLSQTAKSRLILRGDGFVLAAIAFTLIADSVAAIRNPVAPVGWGGILLAELAGMILLAVFCAIVLLRFWLQVKTAEPPRELTPADAIDDLLTLVRVPIDKAEKFLPRGFVEWIDRMNSDVIFLKAGWINPRVHPWRFAAAVGLAMGFLLLAAQLREGLPPSLAIGLLVTGIFMGGEFLGVLIGFTVVGGFLGLRPSILRRKGSS